ncbi:unnamed protein product [Ostreobium quekettii]|uniref:Uncharacterized protein n=1 Tax=Ostreobium quekettii TaxID=121088 RepID=A0A8S1J1H4_9CHLO|nr:unnamed protein product [Ostreobium quekettii]CAD7701041.1 unnamed protein product [Ostreobium quekettii]|eukprot:evm.model.scf_1574.3 EVM.evm.TU.scf_1574.3   scf_1574:33108-33428(+)
MEPSALAEGGCGTTTQQGPITTYCNNNRPDVQMYGGMSSTHSPSLDKILHFDLPVISSWMRSWVVMHRAFTQNPLLVQDRIVLEAYGDMHCSCQCPTWAVLVQGEQ